MPRTRSRASLAVTALLIGLLLLGLTALAGLAAPLAGKGNQQCANAAQYQYGQTKVTICHKGNMIRVAQSAVKTHLGHGDTLGRC